MTDELFEQLISPIPGPHPCGQDLSFSPQFDAIREARRQDDALLEQGEWETKRKHADWPAANRQCIDLLRHQTKDLQVAVWYVESCTQQMGFSGLHFALRVLEVFVSEFWEFIYPQMDEDNLDERISKLEWLNYHLPVAIRSIPLTAASDRNTGWVDWNQALHLENLRVRNEETRESASKIEAQSLEVLERMEKTTEVGFYKTLDSEIGQASSYLDKIEKQLDLQLGGQAISLNPIRNAIADCEKIMQRILAMLSPADCAKNLESDQTHATVKHSIQQQKYFSITSDISQKFTMTNRADAIHALRMASSYFEQHEPHSPVALLAAKAARWAEMPFEEWLESVIKDDGTLKQLKDLLDIQKT